MRYPQRADEGGFTLTEILVALVILGLVAAAVTPQVMGRLDTSKVRAARLQAETLAAAVDMFRIDTGRYPAGEEGLRALVSPPDNETRWAGPYVRSPSSLIDPWERPFMYRPAGTGSFEIVSYGADGAAGGDGPDGDIVFPDFSEVVTPER